MLLFLLVTFDAVISVFFFDNKDAVAVICMFPSVSPSVWESHSSWSTTSVANKLVMPLPNCVVSSVCCCQDCMEGWNLWWMLIMWTTKSLAATFCVLVAFSWLVRIWGECSTFHSRLHFFFIFFFKVKISLRTLIPLFRPGSVQSGLANCDDCGWMFLDKLRVSLFPDRFPHYAWTAA